MGFDGDQIAIHNLANKVNRSFGGGDDWLIWLNMEVNASVASSIFRYRCKVILFKIFIEVGDGFGPDFRLLRRRADRLKNHAEEK